MIKIKKLNKKSSKTSKMLLFDKTQLKGLITYLLIAGIFILAFFIIKPILFSIIYGILLAYILYPVYMLLSKRIKNNTLAASIFCFIIFVILTLFAFIFFQFLFKQLIDFYLNLQKIDLSSILNNLLPQYLSSDISTRVSTSLNSALSGLIASFLEKMTEILVNIPSILLQLSVVIFVFFFALRDGEKAIEYVKSLAPFKKETQDRFFKQFKDITNSVLIGHVVIGILQGVVAGIGYYIFGVENIAILTLVTIIAAIIPVVGPWAVWVPVDIYLFARGNTGAGIGLLIYGTILVSTLENFLRPMIVSRRTEVNSLIILIGMMGGLLAFGLLGIILGPLILAYVLLVFELYRKHTSSEDLIFKKVES